MTYGEIKDKIAYLDTDTIVAACKDIHIWRESGSLPKDSMLNVLSTDYHCDNLRVLEDMIMENAHARFKWVVPLLLTDDPRRYIK